MITKVGSIRYTIHRTRKTGYVRTLVIIRYLVLLSSLVYIQSSIAQSSETGS